MSDKGAVSGKPHTRLDDSALSHNTVLCGIGLDDLELHGSHAATNEERVTLSDWPVCFQGERLDVDVENIAAKTLSSNGRT